MNRIDALRQSVELRRSEAIRAQEYVKIISWLLDAINGEQQFPERPIRDAYATALEEAYEAVLLWRTAVAEWRKAQRVSPPQS